MKKIIVALALAGLCVPTKSSAVSLDDLQFWTGTGTNRAALVVAWSTPEDTTYSTVPVPVASQSLVWGYRFNGSATAADMLLAIAAADPRFYAVGSVHPLYGLGITALGYHLGGPTPSGLADSSATNYFSRGLQTNTTVYIDAAAPLNPNDLYWGGWNGPNWELWTESGGAGGFVNCPDRGAGSYWTSTDPAYASSGFHGQWDYNYGLSSLPLTNGSWVGFTVAAGPWDFNLSAPYNAHKRAPAMPDPALTALVRNFAGSLRGGQWQGQFVSCTNWLYALERSTNLQSWITVTDSLPGNGTTLNLADPAPPAGRAFYRVRAEHP